MTTNHAHVMPVKPALAEAVSNQFRASQGGSRRTFNRLFRMFATGAARMVGSPWAFLSALFLVVIWAMSYRLFVPAGGSAAEHEQGFNTWQLVINTATTIVTFLMVFLIQNTQNRDAKAIHLKLDELIRALQGARTRLVDLQSLTDEELDHLEAEFKRIHERECRRSAQEAQAAGGASDRQGIGDLADECSPNPN